MKTVILGKTGLEVSVLGLGCGGYSKLGLVQNRGDDNAESIVRKALDSGITLVDTARGYGTEHHVGAAVRDFGRDRITVCTKSAPRMQPGVVKKANDLERSIDESLEALGLDCIDVYQLHGVHAEEYIRSRDVLIPALHKMVEKGKIRFFGITEAFEKDTTHQMQSMAARDGCWHTLMVGYNIINQSADTRVFPSARKSETGILGMFAVRHALVDDDRLREVVAVLVERGEIDSSLLDPNDPLGFARAESESGSLPEVAYRFSVHNSDIHVTLCGTGSTPHLEDNIRAAQKPPLSPETTRALKKIFANVASESGKALHKGI